MTMLNSKDLRLLRIEYIETTVEVLREAKENPIGAQERVADRQGKQPSVVSDHIKRVAKTLGASFFESGRERRLTASGILMLTRGGHILAELERLESELKEIRGQSNTCLHAGRSGREPT